MDDTLSDTILICTTRANLACFTSDKVSKHNICPQETCDTGHQLRRLIKETAAYYFIGYYAGGYQHAGQYLIFKFTANMSQYQ